MKIIIQFNEANFDLIQKYANNYNLKSLKKLQLYPQLELLALKINFKILSHGYNGILFILIKNLQITMSFT